MNAQAAHAHEFILRLSQGYDSLVGERGEALFTLKGKEGIHRIAPTSLLVADNHSVQFLIRDVQALDKGSRKILDRFL